MADILNDEPSDYAGDQQLQDQDSNIAVDGESGNEFRASLRSLNRVTRGHSGLPAYNVRTVLEFGAVGDGESDDYQHFQEALGSFGSEGGTLLIPPRSYQINVPRGQPLIIPPNVYVKGLGKENTFLKFRINPLPDNAPGDALLTPAIRFMIGNNHGRISDLGIQWISSTETLTSVPGIGLSFVGSQFNIATNLQIWDFAIGVDIADGVSMLDEIHFMFSAYNELSNFLVARCPLGIRCYRHGNENWIERGRVFWSFGQPQEEGGEGTGVGIDIDAGSALSIRSVTVESANTCLRFRVTGATASGTCEVSSCYFEPRPSEDPPHGPFRIFDISYPDLSVDGGVTYLRLGANHYEGNIGRLDVPPQALADFSAMSTNFFGALTHFAAHAHRQFSENHDIRRYSAAFTPGEWSVHFSATITEETGDFYSGGRTLRVTRTTSPNDGIRKLIRVPEDTDWITVGFRYKKILNDDGTGSAIIGLFASSGSNSANGADEDSAGNESPGMGYRERWLTLPKSRTTDIVVAMIEVDHGPNNGTSILVDAIWCVPGRVRTADFRYEQRVQYLESPQLLLERSNVIANEQWSVDWSTLTGLATAPRGSVGAILGIHLTATRTNSGRLISRPISVAVDETIGSTVYAEYDGRISTRQMAVRRPSSIDPTTIRGNFVTELGASFTTDYQIYIVGWILG